jgi:hypothetical protein
MKINDAITDFHLLYEMAHAKKGSTQVSHSACYCVVCYKITK